MQTAALVNQRPKARSSFDFIVYISVSFASSGLRHPTLLIFRCEVLN
ncbi:MAG: hypothetical protein ACTS4V_00770 [Candidatus Hodgkinia cicadicola]